MRGAVLAVLAASSGPACGSLLDPPPPAFGFVARATAVVIGRAVVEPGVERVPNTFPGIYWRTARVTVDEVLLGRPPAEVRFRLPADDRPWWEAVEQAVRWRAGQVDWADRPVIPTGRRGVFILHLPEPGGRYWLGSVGPIPDPDTPTGAAELRRVRLAVLVRTDPRAALTAAAADDRYLAAGLLLRRYFWAGIHAESERRVPVPGDLNELILHALAERTDWLTLVPVVGRPHHLTLLLDRWRVGWPPWAPVLPPHDGMGDDPATRRWLTSRLGVTAGNRATNWLLDFGTASVWHAGFHRWLDGPGAGWVIHTHPSGLRPPGDGGWN